MKDLSITVADNGYIICYCTNTTPQPPQLGVYLQPYSPYEDHVIVFKDKSELLNWLEISLEPK